jgi:hypothetical protein
VHGLDKTEHRTGVLIFASTAERYAEIVADAGINEKVTADVWDDAVNALVVDQSWPTSRRLLSCDRTMRRGARGAFSTGHTEAW